MINKAGESRIEIATAFAAPFDDTGFDCTNLKQISRNSKKAFCVDVQTYGEHKSTQIPSG